MCACWQDQLPDQHHVVYLRDKDEEKGEKEGEKESEEESEEEDGKGTVIDRLKRTRAERREARLSARDASLGREAANGEEGEEEEGGGGGGAGGEGSGACGTRTRGGADDEGR